MKTFKTDKGTELKIIDLKGKDYLLVQDRLVWFREEKPSWTIESEFIQIGDKSATAKATIKNEQGRIMSTAHKHQGAMGFANFIEKAETGAIGRALAFVGYGTQFCGDELEEGDEIADAPVEHRPTAVQSGLAPICDQDGNKMMPSKFNPNEWYCSKCKSKKSRVA